MIVSQTWVDVYKQCKLQGKIPSEAARIADQWLADKEVKEQKLIKDFMDALTTGCGTCTYEEAESELMNHCASCCFKVTTAAYELFVTNKASISI